MALVKTQEVDRANRPLWINPSQIVRVEETTWNEQGTIGTKEAKGYLVTLADGYSFRCRKKVW